MERYCSAGDHYLDVSEFWKRGATYQPNCKRCQSIINKQRYAANSRTHITNVLKNNKERRERFRAWKQTLSCAHCGESYYKCLDFHHLNSSTKEFGISQVVGAVSINRLRNELSQCVVLCKNCHVKTHANVITLTDAQLKCVELPDI